VFACVGSIHYSGSTTAVHQLFINAHHSHFVSMYKLIRNMECDKIYFRNKSVNLLNSLEIWNMIKFLLEILFVDLKKVLFPKDNLKNS